MEGIADRSLRIERTFEAPIEMVWRVWTKPELIAQWWGPDGFSNSIDEMEVRNGGTWSFTMHGPDGKVYRNEYIFSEVIPHRKLVMKHLTGPKFTTTIHFYEEGERTRMEWEMVFEKAPDLEQAIKVFKADEGLQQNIVKLSHFLKNFKKMSETTFIQNGNELTVKRVFNAPQNLVWRTWTEADLLDQWWAPKPWRSETSEMNFTEGGHRLYAMIGPQNETHWGITEYIRISKPESFSGKDSFCDEKGKVNTAAPVSNFMVSFLAKGEETEVIMVTEYATEEDLKTVIEMGMKEGLSMAFQNLDNLLEEMD